MDGWGLYRWFGACNPEAISCFLKNTITNAKVQNSTLSFVTYICHMHYGWMQQTSCIPYLNPLYWPKTNPFWDPPEGQAPLRNQVFPSYLQMWDEEMRGRIVQSCPRSPRFLPFWQHSCTVRGWISAVLGWRIRNRQKEACSEMETYQGCSWGPVTD